MDSIERLSNLIESVIAPQLVTISKNLAVLSDGMSRVQVSQERHSTKIDYFEERFHALKCDENTNIMRRHGSRIALLENDREKGHAQNIKCQEKNDKVDEALMLARQNKRQNEAQEERYKAAEKTNKARTDKIINMVWGMVVVVAGSASMALFSYLWLK